ncbi:extracellular catalytic domain type 2 short-chain-length polyhydroxyalkanoate depolymerase [Pseudothauera rhizosphaerae]|uniref:Fibronectin type-III domain-containing protein n=1 Tax=Pseudothauera rhizosphaerae TaxID=2565932 RepID=A0A4S4AYJ2_9RHOO|nr:hypothetical protein [Pseudothauera rhizosphaerae]THF64398.1 hypothetical protein E6O51_03570 [Pseudothauera rhizosphaerae]
MPRRLFSAALVLLLAGAGGTAAADEPLPELVLDTTRITVSGISSGAYMAVQFGTVHSGAVSGVAATAGGPYFCAGGNTWGGLAVGGVMARCMQGDPDYPATPITAAHRAQMEANTRDWAAQGRIDPLDGLARQRVWIFHGYNDGIVKRPVSDALADWYSAFVPQHQVFYRNDLNAAHGQISAACAAPQAGANCNVCAQTGGNFINHCADRATGAADYDAAGAALQLFHGPLQRTPTAALTGRVLSFDQTPYVRRGDSPLAPARASMGQTGYLYLPAACAAGQPCRLHVAFHGCQQYAGRIGTAFVDHAGFNEWADANRIAVLYPQAADSMPTLFAPTRPINPNGCWDWWGYNDFLFDPAGRYATRDGLQIAAVWRMVQRLAGGGSAGVPATPASGTPVPQLADVSATRVVLVWTPVAGAAGYRIVRSGAGEPEVLGGGSVDGPSFVDTGLAPATAYRYRIHVLDAAGAEGPPSAELAVTTAAAAPACDPYYSLAQDRPVDARNRPTAAVCP